MGYQNWSEDIKNRYDIVQGMRRYQESNWHRYWKGRFESECDIEKGYKNYPLSNDERYKKKWRLIKAYYRK